MRRVTLLTNPDKCNLHCPLCFLRQRNFSKCYGEMPFETALAAIEKFSPKEVIPSTMGEPLLYSHFEDLLNVCQNRGIRLNLTTNGTFPDKWNCEDGMKALLIACSDIKISTLAYEMGGFSRTQWSQNVERLLNCRHQLSNDKTKELSTISLQVTLHRENIEHVDTILHYAESIAIHRIKWNPVVFLDDAPQTLRSRYEIDHESLEKLRHDFCEGSLHSDKVQNEGSLFFETFSSECPMAEDCNQCSFKEEVWIWPDGHEDHCPNPKRRWK